MPQRLLLGPQRPHINLPEAFRGDALPDGPVAVVSAGWREAEADIDDVRELVPRRLTDLELYRRAELIFAQDAQLHSAYRRRQDRLMELQALYRMRLKQALLAARQVRRANSAPDLVAGEERHAMSQLRALDRHHRKRVRTIHSDFEQARAASVLVTEHSEAVAEILADHETVLITGGHVMVLLNRLQLFGLTPLLAQRHIVAWSAGVMVLSDRVVLFHDQTPQGKREPELLGNGLGLLPGYVFLPDARRRLLQNDAVRSGVFSRRFAPERCITLDNGALLHLDEHGIRRAEGVGYISTTGAFLELRG